MGRNSYKIKGVNKKYIYSSRESNRISALIHEQMSSRRSSFRKYRKIPGHTLLPEIVLIQHCESCWKLPSTDQPEIETSYYKLV